MGSPVFDEDPLGEELLEVSADVLHDSAPA